MNKIKFIVLITFLCIQGCGQHSKKDVDFKSNRYIEIDFYNLKGLKKVINENREKYPQYEIKNLSKTKIKVIEFYSEKSFYEITYEKGKNQWFSIINNIDDAEYNGKILYIIEKERNIIFAFRPLDNGKSQLTSFSQFGGGKYISANFSELFLSKITEKNYPNIDSLINSTHLITKTYGFYSLMNNKVLKYEDRLFKSDNGLIETTKKCYDLNKVNYSINNRMGMIFCNDCNVNCE